jgi:hypothetical protein
MYSILSNPLLRLWGFHACVRSCVIDTPLLLGAVDVLEGLLPRLPAVVTREVLPPPSQPASPLVAILLQVKKASYSVCTILVDSVWLIRL